nr:juvenile hormone esterase-like [Leptinotarsa decemlineata]
MKILIGRYSLLMLLGIAHAVISEKLGEDLVVQLRDGKIRGHILKSENGINFYAFQEIPYAAPPVGRNRFQPPKHVKPWKGILNTTKNTKICYQNYSKHGLEMDEDCLYINVYTPLKPESSSEKLPVLFWIHGGGNKQGSGAYEYFGPKYIIDHRVVVATINYRLGPIGFLTTEDKEIPANNGLMDQKFAMKWVHRNIHLFQGDPRKVTIIGQSSGSVDVGTHILGRHSNELELFRSAIMLSGSPLVFFGHMNSRERAFDCGRFLDKNFKSNSSEHLLQILQRVSAHSLFQACGAASDPIIEKSNYFSYAPLQSLLDGNFRRIPILLGFTSEEMIFSALNSNVSSRIALDKNPAQLVPLGINTSPENRTKAGELIKGLYTNTSFEHDTAAYVRWTSDNQMNIHMCEHAKLMSHKVPTYFYKFSYDGEIGEGPKNNISGTGRVQHGGDLHYLWEVGNNFDLNKFPEKDQLTLHRYVKLITNFVKYQNPTPEKDTLLENITWPTTNGESLLYLNINDTLELKKNPRQCNEQMAIFDKYMEPPFIYY